MLTIDGSSFGNLCRTFEYVLTISISVVSRSLSKYTIQLIILFPCEKRTRSAVLPSWVWLPWIPQILSNLCRIEARAMKAIIVGISKDHPQAMYYALRSFYLDRQDEDKKSSNDDDTSLSSSRLSEEFMSVLRKTHPLLWNKLEAVLGELINRFRPSYEAELLHSLIALLQKASFGNQLDACKKTLALLGSKFFSSNQEKQESSSSISATSKKAALFQAKYAALYRKEFLEEEEDMNEEDMLAKLEKWKNTLEHDLSRVPKMFNLYEVSPSLSSFSSEAPDLWAGACESKSLTQSNRQYDAHAPLDNTLYRASRTSVLAAAKASTQGLVVAATSEGLGGLCGGGSTAIEIPGQYAPTSSSALDSRPFPELHIKLVRFHQTVELTNSSTKHYVHQITMIGSDGKKYNFLLQICQPVSIRADERSAQLNYVMRKILRQDSRASRRCLATSSSVVVPTAQRMKMIAIKPTHQSLYSVSRHVQGTKSGELVSYFQAKIAEIANNPGNGEKGNNEAISSAKLKVYNDICDTLAPPNVLSTYMRELLPSIEQLFQFRHTFATQLASNSLLQYALSITERNPSRFAFCHSTGHILSQDFRSQYTLPNGSLEKHDVPFRLTRNITEFIGPFVLEGVYVPSFAIISAAMDSKRSELEPVLHLLLRDDVMAWCLSRSPVKNDQKIQDLERQLSDRIWTNVRSVQDRFRECSPLVVEDAAAEALKSSPTPIDMKVRSLVDAATSSENLCMMPASYEAWL